MHRILLATALTLVTSVSAAAIVPSCADGNVTQNADGSLSCTTGWVLIDYSPLLPPIDLTQANTLLVATLGSWSVAIAVGILIKTVRGRA